MNGYNNPNQAHMGNFGANKNYMMHADNNHVNLNDLLPEDPYKQQQKSKWIKESEKNHELRQKEIAKEQAKFVPNSFKNSQNNMFVDIQITNEHKADTMSNEVLKPSPPKQMHRRCQKQQPKPFQNWHRNHNQINHQQKSDRSNNVNNHFEVQSKGVIEKPMSEPYFPKKAEDPFSKYIQKQEPIKMRQKQSSPIKNNLKKVGSKVPHIQAEAIFYCTVCGKAILNEWTEDSKQRKYHNECFVCCECGIALGSVGKYVRCEKGLTCRICRDKQIEQQKAVKY